MDWTKITEPIDLLFASTPCQSVSYAGKREGMKKGTDAESALIWATEEAIKTLQPKVIMFENVKGMLSRQNSKDFKEWIATVSSYGYDCQYKVLNAKDFGTPQNRERVFIVCLRTDIYQPFQFPSPRPLDKRLIDVLDKDVDEHYYLPQEKVDKVLSQINPEALERIAIATLTKWHQIKLREVGNVMPSNHSCGRVYGSDGLSPTVMHHHGVPPMIMLANVANPRSNFPNPEEGRVYSPDGIYPTIKSTGRVKKVMVAQYNETSEETPKIQILGYAMDKRENNPKFPYNQRTAVHDPNGLMSCESATQYKQPPLVMVTSCALRSRNYAGRGEALETSGSEIANTLTSVYKDSMILEQAMLTHERTEKGKELRKTHHGDKGIPFNDGNKIPKPRTDGLSNTVTTVAKDTYLLEGKVNQVGQLIKNGSWDNPQAGRIYDPTEIAPTLNTCQGGNLEPKFLMAYFNKHWELIYRIRKITEREAYRLMDVSEEDIDKLFNYRETITLKNGTTKEIKIANSQHLKLAGNSIVVGCLTAIFEQWLYPKAIID